MRGRDLGVSAFRSRAIDIGGDVAVDAAVDIPPRRVDDRSMRRLRTSLLLVAIAAAPFLACKHEEEAPSATSPSSGASASASGEAAATPAPPGGGACGIRECLRAVRCVESCGGAAVQIGCCVCPAGSFDDIACPKQ